MNSVWLVYEDDYGGLFSAWYLTKVFTEEQAATDYANGKWLRRVVESRRELSGFLIDWQKKHGLTEGEWFMLVSETVYREAMLVVKHEKPPRKRRPSSDS